MQDDTLNGKLFRVIRFDPYLFNSGTLHDPAVGTGDFKDSTKIVMGMNPRISSRGHPVEAPAAAKQELPLGIFLVSASLRTGFVHDA